VSIPTIPLPLSTSHPSTTSTSLPGITSQSTSHQADTSTALVLLLLQVQVNNSCCALPLGHAHDAHKKF